MRNRLKRKEVPNFVPQAFKAKGGVFNHWWEDLQRKVLDPAAHPDVMFVPKDGLWLDRQAKFSWIYYQGHYFKYDAPMFLYELRLDNVRSFSKAEVEAISAMIRLNLPLQSRLASDWDTYCESRQLHRTIVEVRKAAMQGRKRMAAFKAARGIP